MQRRSVFTLVELMITIAIVATLAAVAMSGFMQMKWRTQHAEAPLIFDGMHAASMATWLATDDDSTDVAVDCSTSVQLAKNVPNGRAHPWGAVCPTGFRSDGDVFGAYQQYACVDVGKLCGGSGLPISCGVGPTLDYTVYAVFDADRNGTCAVFGRYVTDGAVTGEPMLGPPDGRY